MASYVEELFSLDGLVAVVTGGSSGIGRAIAGALARAGGSTVVVARGEDRLAATVDALTADGCRAAYVRGDLGSRKGALAAADESAKVFGEPDILVNCAGVNLRPPMAEIDEQTWDATMAVNPAPIATPAPPTRRSDDSGAAALAATPTLRR